MGVSRLLSSFVTVVLLVEGVAMAASTDLDARIDAAVALARGGDAPAAIAALETLRGEAPSDARLAADLALLYHRAGDDRAAVATVRGLAPAALPAYALAELARAHRQVGELARAQTLLETYIESAPEDAFAAEAVLADLRRQRRSAAADRAVAKARSGDVAGGLADLEQLRRSAPGDPRLASDLVALRARSGDVVGALDLVELLGAGRIDGYALDELANASLAAPASASKARLAAALSAAPPGAASDWSRLARLYEADGRHYDAFDAYDRALRLDPDDRAAVRGRVQALSAMGAGWRAAELAAARPDIFDASERAALEAGRAAVLTRWGALQAADPADRFAGGERALAALAANAANPAASPEVRARTARDEVVALRVGLRMSEAVRAFAALPGGPEDQPAYVLAAAADAHLHLEQPARAEALYRQALERDPGNPEVETGLVYALIEQEKLDEAMALADRMVEAAPPWIDYADTAERFPNALKLDALALQAATRLYADRLGEAQDILEWAVQRAPNHSQLRRLLGEVYQARGWPRRAKAEFDLVEQVDLKAATIGVQQGEVARDLRNFAEAERRVWAMHRTFPERKDVRRLRQRHALDHRPFVEGSGRIEHIEDGGLTTSGSDSHAFDTRFYAPLTTPSVRLFAGLGERFGRFAEGRETLLRGTLGLDVQRPNWTGEIEAGVVDATAGGFTAGVAAAWLPDDHWRLGVSGHRNAPDTPLRAIRNDIKADDVGLTVDYRFHESLTVGVGTRVMAFDDGNTRLEGVGRVGGRLLTDERWLLDGDLGFYMARNSKGNETPYYNPDAAFAADVGLELQHKTWRHYDDAFWQRVRVEAGPKWEDGFGTDSQWAVSYGHRWLWNERLEVSYGVGRTSRVFDGDREDAWFGTLDFSLRF